MVGLDSNSGLSDCRTVSESPSSLLSLYPLHTRFGVLPPVSAPCPISVSSSPPTVFLTLHHSSRLSSMACPAPLSFSSCCCPSRHTCLCCSLLFSLSLPVSVSQPHSLSTIAPLLSWTLSPCLSPSVSTPPPGPSLTHLCVSVWTHLPSVHQQLTPILSMGLSVCPLPCPAAHCPAHPQQEAPLESASELSAPGMNPPCLGAKLAG